MLQSGVGIGIDLVEVSRIKDLSIGPTGITSYLEDVFDGEVPQDPFELAKWIAINEAVFKSLKPKAQRNYRGVDLRYVDSGRIIIFPRRRKFTQLTFTKFQLTITHTTDIVIAVVISKISFLNILNISSNR